MSNTGSHLLRKIAGLLGRDYDDRVSTYSYSDAKLLPHRPAPSTVPMVYSDYADRLREHNARAAADAIYNNANELVNNPEFNQQWHQKGAVPPNQPWRFFRKPKCNLFGHYVTASSFDSPDRSKNGSNLVNINRTTGNLINASLLNKMLKDPSKYSKYTSGRIYPVPAELAPFAKGAFASSPTHVGITMGDGTTASAGDKLGAVRNAWGFRGNEKNMQYGYILPEDVDGNVLLEDARKRRQKFVNGLPPLVRKMVDYK